MSPTARTAPGPSAGARRPRRGSRTAPRPGPRRRAARALAGSRCSSARRRSRRSGAPWRRSCETAFRGRRPHAARSPRRRPRARARRTAPRRPRADAGGCARRLPVTASPRRPSHPHCPMRRQLTGSARARGPSTCRRRSTAARITAPTREHDRGRQERDVVARTRGPRVRRFALWPEAPWSALLVWLAASVARIASPSEPPTCWAVLNSPEARPASSPRDAAGSEQRDRHEREAHADAHRQQPSEQIAEVAAVNRQLRQPRHPGGRERDPDDRDACGRRGCGSTAARGPAPITIPAVTGRNASPAFSGL